VYLIICEIVDDIQKNNSTEVSKLRDKFFRIMGSASMDLKGKVNRRFEHLGISDRV